MKVLKPDENVELLRTKKKIAPSLGVISAKLLLWCCSKGKVLVWLWNYKRDLRDFRVSVKLRCRYDESIVMLGMLKNSVQIRLKWLERKKWKTISEDDYHPLF